MSGTSDKIKGSVKETAGKAMGDKRTEAEGKVEKAKGEVKDAAHDVQRACEAARQRVGALRILARVSESGWASVSIGSRSFAKRRSSKWPLCGATDAAR